MGEWIYNSSFDTVMDFAVTVDNVFKRYGQVEALQTQAADQLRALASRQAPQAEDGQPVTKPAKGKKGE